ncbi:MAG: putative basic amino acid antiporter YfcC [Steroidobacteraceae bacterium]|jgi:uncharacterized ion transporter superfamily protein YfcC|nr:putative basic amino acid antiporter YfcC [Steroidobacteraceae bacterium]
MQEQQPPQGQARPPAWSGAPDTLLILAAVALLVALVVAFVAPGRFTDVVPAGPESKQVTVRLASFETVGDARAVPLFAEGGGLGLLNLPFEGLVAGDKWGSAVGLVAFLLVLGGSFGVLMKTGAIDRTIVAFVGRYERRMAILVPGLFVMFSLGGAIFGMGEETIPFILLLLPVFARIRLDAICVVLVTYVATQIGFATSWMNPFSVVVAQGVAGLDPVSGAPFRIAMWTLFTALGALLTLRYALTQQRDRPAAPIAAAAGADLGRAGRSDLVVLLVLAATLAWVIWGVTTRGYYLPELAAQFFTMGVATGLVAWLADRRRMPANRLAEGFREGAATMLPVALIVALAKGLVLLLGGTDPAQPSVLNTLLYTLAHGLEGLPATLAAWLMLLVQSAINFLVPSGSGQAALTMPIMAPLGDLLGVSRQVAVLAFQLGDGLTNLIIPTSAVLMGVLGAARLDWLVWARFFARWMLALLGLASVFVIVAVRIGYA